MRHSLLLACSGICIAAAQAVEYGSTTLTHVAQPESAVFDYATQVCGKSAALPRVLSLPGGEAKAGHIVCMSGESRTGDVFPELKRTGFTSITGSIRAFPRRGRRLQPSQSGTSARQVSWVSGYQGGGVRDPPVQGAQGRTGAHRGGIQGEGVQGARGIQGGLALCGVPAFRVTDYWNRLPRPGWKCRICGLPGRGFRGSAVLWDCGAPWSGLVSGSPWPGRRGPRPSPAGP